MNVLQRWWIRNQGVLLGITLVLLAALWLRYTQAGVLAEAWYWVNWPVLGLQTVPPDLSNNRIVELEGQISSLEIENRRLKALLALPENTLADPLAAQVIGRDGGHWWRYLLLSRGSQDGVQKGNPVTAPGGLVGEVIAVTPHTSRVLLVTDPTSRIGVVITRTGAMGVLSGQFKNEGLLELFDNQTPLKVGDTVVTSGLSSRFPANFMVGKVAKLPENSTATPQATVRFSTPLDGVQWVLIYPTLTGKGLNAQPLP